MNPTEAPAWRRSSPFAVIFFLGRIAKAIAQNLVQAAAPVAAFLVAFGGDLSTRLWIAGTVVFVATVAAAILRYWFFRFQVTDRAILIRDGVFNKKQLDIKFERIQAVNTEANPVFRLLGLVTIRFDTAGSSGDEGFLPAVPGDFATDLRKKIGRRRDVDPQALAPGDAPPLLELGWRDMFRIGLSDRRVLVVFAFLGPLAERMGDEVDEAVERYAETAAENFGQLDAATGFMLAATLVLAVLVLLALLSVCAAFFRYHGFRLFEESGTLRSYGGLLTRHENSMTLAKLQVLRLYQGIVLRLFRRYRLVARQATSGGGSGGGSSFVIPVAEEDFVARMRALAFDPEAAGVPLDPRSPAFHRISPYYIRSRLTLFGLFPALAACAAAWPAMGAASFWFLSWPLFVLLVALGTWRRAGVCFDGDGLARRSGLLGFRVDAFLFRKVQRVTLSESWFQRRRGLASLKLYLASGSVRIPFIDVGTARALRDYVLYKVESSRRSWH